MKTSKAFRIPLTDYMVETLRELAALAYGLIYVLPSPQYQRGPISDATLRVALGRLDLSIPHFVIHDLRRTARTHWATLADPHVCESALNHTMGRIVE